MRSVSRIMLLLAAALAAGCASRQSAPVIERAPGAQVPAVPAVRATAVDQRPETYTVKRGETLYGIALDHGLDYRELAEWNGITNPGVIHVGDTLRLRAPEAPAQSAVQVKPVTTAGAVQSRPLGPGLQAAGPAKRPDEVTIASIEPRRSEVKPEVKPEARPEAKPMPEAPAPAAKPEVPPPAPGPQARGDDDEKVDWSWPVSGRIVARFSDPGNKGVDISAKLGDPVLASAPGRVVYSGSGLRGYGKLIIIKHNPTYLSAYAHNNQILVKEGQSVAKGQKIGEVGSTDADAPKLHFEIRRLGKPVDPLKFLPERPS